MKRVKILLSLICAVACLLTCAFVPSLQNSVLAETAPTALKEIYPSDFGIDDGIYNVKQSTTYQAGDSLLGTIFTMDFRFVSGNGLWIQYASPENEWYGLSFRFNKQTGTFILRDDTASYLTKQITFDPETAGVDFFSDTVRIQISLEAVDNDGLGEENDLKIGVFFNYKLYGGEYIYENDTALNLGKYLFVHVDFSDVLSTYEISSPKTENSQYYLQTTPADFGIADGAVDNAVTTDIGFNGKNFKVNADLQTGDYIDYRGIKISRGNMGELTVSDSTGKGSFATATVLPDESEALTPITYSDFGISDETYTYNGNDIAVRKNYQNGTTLDNTYFSAKIKIHDGAGSSVAEIRHGGNDSGLGWTGIWCVFEAGKITVRNTKDNVSGYVFTPSDVGLTTFENTEFTFGISLRYIDADTDALCDDVQYGIWVNGNLVQNKYAYVLDAVSIFGLKTAIYCSGSTNNEDDSTMTVASVTAESPIATQQNGITFPLKETCFEIFTLTDSDNLDATVFADGTQIADFTVSDYKNTLTNNISVKGNIKSPEKEISYKSEVISFDELGVANGFTTSSNGSHRFNLDSEKVISGYVIPKGTGGAEINIKQDLTKIVSFSDFGIADGEYTGSNVAVGTFRDDLTDSFFSAQVKFANNNPIFYYGGTNGSAGIKFQLNSGVLNVYDFDGNLIDSINAANTGAGVTSFRAKSILLGVALGVADTDSDGQKDDVKLVLWFGGEYYNTYNIENAVANVGKYVTLTSLNTTSKLTVSSAYSLIDATNIPFDIESKAHDITKYILNGTEKTAFDINLKATDLDDDGKKNDISVTYFVNGEATENRQYFIKDCVLDGNLTGIVAEITVTDATVYNRLPEDDLEETAVYSLHEAPYLLMGVGEIYVNREGDHYAGETIETAGEYIIVRNFLGKEYVEKVALWRYGNADGRDELNILDYVAAQRYIANDSNSSLARKGADLDLDGSLTAKDIVSLKRILLGIDTLKEYTYETDKWSLTENVMPIVGYNGPICQFLDENGEIVDESGIKAYDTVTDNVFKAIAEAGINGISYIESAYSDSNKETTLRTLELASKYGIGVTVNYGVSADVTDTKFAELLGKFSHYTAFKGLFIMDEPSTAKLAELSTRSVMANKFANTIGYTNLLPNYATLEAVPDYEAYIDEYCSTFGAKMISFDHYVLENYANYSSKTLAMQRYFGNLDVVRTAAEKYDIPFWGFLQTGDAHGKETKNTVVTTKSQMLWNLNTQLAYGAKGMQYFTLVQPNGYSYSNTESPEFDYNAGGIIGANGQKTQYYDHAVAANAQIAAVDNILMNSDSKDVLAIGYYAKSHTGIDKSAYGSVIGVSTNETALLDLTYGAIVGCFDYNGKEAYYIVNYDWSDAHDITVTFNNAKTYAAYSTTLNGVAGSGSSYTASLGAGEAVLVVLD